MEAIYNVYTQTLNITFHSIITITGEIHTSFMEAGFHFSPVSMSNTAAASCFSNFDTWFSKSTDSYKKSCSNKRHYDYKITNNGEPITP